MGDTVNYAASVKEEVEKIRAGQMSFFAEHNMRTGLDGAGDSTVSGPRALVVIDFLGGFNASMGVVQTEQRVDSTDGGVVK